MKENRSLIFYEEYFTTFLRGQQPGVRQKILWTLEIIQELDLIPGKYFKYLQGSSSIYEIRVEFEGNIFRVLCFFDKGNIIVVGHGFQKKTQKTPAKEIKKAETIKKSYFNEKEPHNIK